MAENEPTEPQTVEQRVAERADELTVKALHALKPLIMNEQQLQLVVETLQVLAAEIAAAATEEITAEANAVFDSVGGGE